MKYKAVIFDLYGTLVHSWSHEIEEMILTQMAAVLSLSVSDLAKAWRMTDDDRLTGVFKSYESCIREICRRLKIIVTNDQINAASIIRAKYAKLIIEPHDGIKDVLFELRVKGYRIGLISNISMEGVKSWETSTLSSLFDVTMLSCLEEMKKPDLRIFRLTCERLVVQPEECLYIADGMDNELEAAAAVGMTPILIRHPGAPVSAIEGSWKGPTISYLNEVFNFLCL